MNRQTGLRSQTACSVQSQAGVNEIVANTPPLFGANQGLPEGDRGGGLRKLTDLRAGVLVAEV